MTDLIASPLFPVEELSTETLVRLPDRPNAESASVKMYIVLAESAIFVQGFSQTEISARPPSILRGCLFVRVLKPVKIKNISLKLTGIQRTEWPEGIPPKKVDHCEINNVIQHTWPFFNFQNSYPVTENSRNNADFFIPKVETDSELTNFTLDGGLTPVTSAVDTPPSLKPIKSASSIVGSAFRSISMGRPNILKQPSELDITATRSVAGSTVDDSNKLFVPGDYIYSFEQTIHSNLPETTRVTFGSVKYFLDASLDRSGTFKTSLTARKPVTIVRSPSQDSSEENEPIIINRDWEDKLKYEVVVSSKLVVLNSYLPVSFRLTPMDKIKIHKLRVSITEHLEYYCGGKRVHRTEPPRKFLLLEHLPPEGFDNLLAVDGDEITGKEFDFQVYVPERIGDQYRIHPDTSFDEIQSHHWIKLAIRISRAEPTPEDPTKRKQYELSIDSPIHILSPFCVHANTLLPSYIEQMAPEVLGDEQRTNSIDLMMSPKVNTGVILDANLFHPDADMPAELLSPQAKPFSPSLIAVSSPGLHSLRNFTGSPISKGYDEPPPAFHESVKDTPPSYEQVLKQDSVPGTPLVSATPTRNSHESILLPPSEIRVVKSHENLESLSTQRTGRTNRSYSTEENDLGGNLKFNILPLRSRSPSRASSPVTMAAGRRSKLIRSALLYNQSFPSSESSNAIDEELASALADDQEQKLKRGTIEDEQAQRESEKIEEQQSPKSQHTLTEPGASPIPIQVDNYLRSVDDVESNNALASSVSSSESSNEDRRTLRNPRPSSSSARNKFPLLIDNELDEADFDREHEKDENEQLEDMIMKSPLLGNNNSSFSYSYSSRNNSSNLLLPGSFNSRNKSIIQDMLPVKDEIDITNMVENFKQFGIARNSVNDYWNPLKDSTNNNSDNGKIMPTNNRLRNTHTTAEATGLNLDYNMAEKIAVGDNDVNIPNVAVDDDSTETTPASSLATDSTTIAKDSSEKHLSYGVGPALSSLVSGQKSNN